MFENNYVVVHNGVLHNEHLLKREHEALGITYISQQKSGQFNDSEALAYDVARYLEGDVDKISAEGSIAFIAIKSDSNGKPVALFFGRNTSNPLRMKKTQYSITLSSEGSGHMIEPNVLYCYNYDTNELTKRDCVIPSGYTAPAYRPYVQDRTHYGNSYVVGDKDDDELAELEHRWQESSEVKDAKESLLLDANHDITKAIQAGQALITKLQGRQIELDTKTEEPGTSEEEINEYCKNEDSIRWLEDAIKSLRLDLGKEARPSSVGGEATDSRHMGFHYTPDHLRPEHARATPTLPDENQTKLLREGRRYGD